MASQNEIARRAGVSQSVVSRVLNGRAAEFGIAAATVARVEAVAAEPGYRPDPAATMLLGRASRLVGVVVRSFDDPFLAAILQELNRGALAAGCTLLVTGLEDGGRADEVRQLQRYRPDALIVVGTTEFSGWSDALFPAGRPVVQIGLPSGDPRIVTCGIDEPAAAGALVAHLRARGHRRIGLLGDRTAASRARLPLLSAALAAGTDPLTPALAWLDGAEGFEAGAAGAAPLLALPEAQRPTAVIATGDLIALGLIRALSERGCAIPATMAVAGYDDVPLAAWLRPALTTIRQPARGLAFAAMAIATGAAPRATLRLSGELVVRESTGGD
mgnify:CR=1 FL=1